MESAIMGAAAVRRVNRSGDDSSKGTSMGPEDRQEGGVDASLGGSCSARSGDDTAAGRGHVMASCRWVAGASCEITALCDRVWSQNPKWLCHWFALGPKDQRPKCHEGTLQQNLPPWQLGKK